MYSHLEVVWLYGRTPDLVFLSRGGFTDLVWFASNESSDDAAEVACSRQQVVRS